MGLDLGSCLPILIKCRDTKANDQGLWTSFDFKYSGGFALTVETRVDLQKLIEAETSGLRDRFKEETRSSETRNTIDITEQRRQSLNDQQNSPPRSQSFANYSSSRRNSQNIDNQIKTERGLSGYTPNGKGSHFIVSV